MPLPSNFDGEVPIEDPEFYLSNPWPVFEWMQREKPLYQYKPLNTVVITRYKDILAIGQRADVFSNARGIFLNEVKYREMAGGRNFSEDFWPPGGEQIGNTDPPRHQELRRVSQGAFTPAAIGELTPVLRKFLEEQLDRLGEGTVDFWPVAASMPVEAACHLLGLPTTDRERVHFWSDVLENLGANISYDEMQAAIAEFGTLKEYITEKVGQRAASRRTAAKNGKDLISVLLDADLDGRVGVPIPSVITFAMTAMAAGADTTRALLLGIAYYLSRNPAQWSKLKADRSLVKGAIEETLRMVTPARAFIRYATSDFAVGEDKIRAGQYVYLLYMAGNRDSTIFSQPHDFDAARKNAHLHLGFGGGPHHCLGARLARMQGVELLNALLDRYGYIEPAEEPTRVSNHLIRNSWTTMPLRLMR